ncbi:flavin-containing monooxygenase [Nocardioides sp. NPDC058538]|uniref:flavin-containing monooxygenase n=1 Tax=Nocardioides sp. NPDC058538 TaxID=3346542 RepID=UPI00364BA7CA
MGRPHGRRPRRHLRGLGVRRGSRVRPHTAGPARRARRSTWRANTYPGCACDVPSNLYSFSFAPNSDWSRVYGNQPEILAYIDRVARERGLEDITRFGVEVRGATWDVESAGWHLDTSDGEITTRFLVAAAGPWNEPKIPDLPGLADFPGEVWHSARWNHDVDLDGKRVAVIGTGASAVQFVPEVQKQVADLHLFQRTVHWVLPKVDHPVPDAEKWVKHNVPFFEKALGAVEYAAMEAVGVAFRRPQPLMHGLQKIGQAYLRAAVRDKDLRTKLTPDYLIGCKRILFSNNYLQSLTKPNVEVHATGVERVEGASVIGTDGSTAEVDAIILGTGFHILDMPVSDLIRGADGRALAEHWAGSPEAYQGTSVSGFPNAFVVLGPSLGTGHGSAFAVAESQVAMITEAITTARAQGWRQFDVTRQAQAAYVEEVQAALAGTAYSGASCHSYFIDANGRNSFSWPWSTSELVRRISRFEPTDFQIARPSGSERSGPEPVETEVSA